MAEQTSTCILRYSDYSSRVLLCVWTWQGFSLFPHSPSPTGEQSFLDASRPASADRVVTYPLPPLYVKAHLPTFEYSGDSFWNSGISSFDFWKIFFSKVRACFVFSTSRPDGRTRHQGLIFCLLFKNWKKNKNLLYCLRNHFQGVCENPWQLATSSRVIWDFLAASPRHESKLKFNKRSSPRKEKEKRYSSPWYCGDPLPTSPTSVDINWHSWTLPVFNTDCDLYYCVLVVWQLRISHLNSLFVFICALTFELSDRRSRESLEKKRKIGDDAYVFSRQDEWRRDGGVRWGRRDSRSCL